MTVDALDVCRTVLVEKVVFDNVLRLQFDRSGNHQSLRSSQTQPFLRYLFHSVAKIGSVPNQHSSEVHTIKRMKQDKEDIHLT